jgi:hypothetical protein
MKRSIVDVTPDEMDKLAREAWANAAHQALERGLPISGSRNGRRFRHDPDGHLEDLGPVGGPLATEQIVAIPNFDLPKLDFQKHELPEAYRKMAEVNLSKADDTYQKVKAVAQAATHLVESSSLIEKGYSAYQLKVMEIAQANTVAAFDLVGKLMSARTFEEFVEISVAHTRKQYEGLVLNSKELATLTRRLSDDISSRSKAPGGPKDSDNNSSNPSVA